MATETVPALEQEAALPSGKRVDIALEASCELASIADALIGAAQDLPADDLAIRGLSIRVAGLASVIMSALSDKNDPVEDITARLTGVPSHREVQHD